MTDTLKNRAPFDSHSLITVASIRPALDNLRSDLGDLSSLRASIREQGILQPLLLAPLDPALPGLAEDPEAAYVVVDGHRRFAAAVAEGLDVVPAMVRALSDAGRVEAMLTTALEKRDLLPTEEAEGYRRLVELGRSQRQIADMFLVSQGHISKTLKLAGLPEQARKAVDAGPDAGGISREQGHALADLPVETVNDLFKGPKPPSRYDIEDRVRQAKAAAKLASTLKELEAKGIPIVPKIGAFHNDDADALPQPLNRLWWVTSEEHAGQPCHAVYVNYGRVIEVCTDEARHPRPEPEAESDAEQAFANWAAIRAARVAAAEAEDAEDARRAAFCCDLVANPKPVDVIGLAAAVTPDLYELELGKELGKAIRLLAVNDDDWDLDCCSDHLAAWVGDDHRRQLRVVYALALAGADNYAHVNPFAEPWELRLQAAYWAHLTGRGYEMSDLERSWMPAAEPAPCEDTSPQPSPEAGEPEPEVIAYPGGWYWECPCGVRSIPFVDEQACVDDCDRHAVDLHGYTPIEADV